MIIKKVGILYHPIKQKALELANELADILTSEGVSNWICSAWEEERASARLDGTDLILTTGGDGTILHAVHVANSKQIPVTGINLGQLGFMTELTVDEAKSGLAVIIRGDGWIDERSMLEAEVFGDGISRTFHALNDVVVARGAVARMILIEARVDGEPLTTYRVDGVITATATGSTGYSLAVGGPILHPQSSEFILLPISPHLSPNYRLVLPSTAKVELKISTVHDATISIDGIINLPVASGTRIMVKSSSRKARFLRIHPASFYGSLNEKLRGRDEVGPGRKS